MLRPQLAPFLRFKYQLRYSPTSYIKCTPSISHFHTTSSTPHATPLPITAHGPPPKAPSPAASDISELRRRQREIFERFNREAEKVPVGEEKGRIDGAIKGGFGGRKQEGKVGDGGVGSKRFWKEAVVREVDGGLLPHLDTRPLRTPLRNPLLIPPTKPHLAHAIALEWSYITSTTQATSRTYLTPLTQLSSRVIDLLSLQKTSPSQFASKKAEIVDMCLKYLGTDTLLTWSPPPNLHGQIQEDTSQGTLRDLQIKTTGPIVDWLTRELFPGAIFRPLDTASGFLATTPQDEGAVRRVRRWCEEELDLWELVGLERVVVSTKSLLIGLRLVGEWRVKQDNGSTAEEGKPGEEVGAMGEMPASKDSLLQNSGSNTSLASASTTTTTSSSQSSSRSYPTPTPSSSSSSSDDEDNLTSLGGLTPGDPSLNTGTNTSLSPPTSPLPSPQNQEEPRIRFTIEDAATAASLEVAWQTRQWGEVEDTHDVEKEDMRRGIGAGWFLVVGE